MKIKKVQKKMNNVNFKRIPHYEHEYVKKPDFHAVDTISVGELIEAGFLNWEDESWKWDYYTEEQYTRLCKKFNDKFFMREISMLPPGQWKREILSKFNRIMPKYKLLYDIINDDELMKKDLILQSKSKYGKERNIRSSFPQTLLGDNSDYASSGKDREYENIQNGDFIEKYLNFVDNYNDIDELILNEFEDYFSPFIAISINGM